MDTAFIKYKPNTDSDTLRRLKEFLEEYNRYLRVCEEYFWIYPNDPYDIRWRFESDLLSESQCTWCVEVARTYVKKQMAQIFQDIVAVRRTVLKDRQQAMFDQLRKIQSAIAMKPLCIDVLYSAKVGMYDYICFDTDSYVKLYTQKKFIDLPFLHTPEFDVEVRKTSPQQIDFSMKGMKVWFSNDDDKWLY